MGLWRCAASRSPLCWGAGGHVGGARFVHWRARIVSEYGLVGMQCVVAAALWLGGPGPDGTRTICCVPACPSPPVHPLRVWGVLWPVGVLGGLVLCGLLAAGAVMMPMVWALQVMQQVMVSLVMVPQLMQRVLVPLVVPMVRVLPLMLRAMVPLVMPMVRVLWVMCRVMGRLAMSVVWVPHVI